MFVDASAIVAILMCEPGFETVADCLRSCRRPLTSGIAVYEAVNAVARQNSSHDDARRTVLTFLSLARIELVPIGEGEMREALSAFAHFGKGRGHPARLNMGDCFAYACARTHDVPLLFVGEDFSRTDIRNAAT